MLTQQEWGYGLPNQGYRRPLPFDSVRTQPGRFDHLRGDVAGGVAAAVLTLPISMGYGLLALSGFGEAYLAQGLLAGLYASIIGCLVAFLLGANSTVVHAPRSMITFLIGAIAVQSLLRSDVPALQTAPLALLLTLTFAIVFLAGLFQALFGALKLGSLVKYIPAPVIAGFQNGAALLILVAQFKPLLGLDAATPASALPVGAIVGNWPTLLVGGTTLGLMLYGARITTRLPPSVLGLLAGVGLYYALAAAGLGEGLGGVVGPIPGALPQPTYFVGFAALVTSAEFAQMLPTLLAGALSLAIVSSLDSMLCARLIQTDTGRRVDDNGELLRLGVGNMVSAGFGGIANGINLGSSFANHRSGGRTRISLLVHVVILVVAVFALSPVIGQLPRVVIAGMLAAIAIQLFDRWTLQILLNLVRGRLSSARRMLVDLLVIVAVTATAVAVNVVVAVIIGTAITVLFFLFRMSKSVVRRTYRCDVVHSRKTRHPKHMEILTREGASILVLELEGPIFFGTAENLAGEIERALKDRTLCVILDLKRINDIDSTGAKILLQLHDRLTAEGRYLLLSSIEDGTSRASFLKDMGVTTALTRRRIFGDVDLAIEWAEDHVLLDVLGDDPRDDEVPYGSMDVFSGLGDDELVVVRGALERRVYEKGAIVFAEGEESKELYTIAKGSATVRLRLAGAHRETRLMTFSAGTVFGELALLDQEVRSASVEAETDLVCYVLAHAAFLELTRQHPAIAIKVLTNLGRELSGRLRRATRTIYQLAS